MPKRFLITQHPPLDKRERRGLWLLIGCAAMAIALMVLANVSVWTVTYPRALLTIHFFGSGAGGASVWLPRLGDLFLVFLLYGAFRWEWAQTLLAAYALLNAVSVLFMAVFVFPWGASEWLWLLLSAFGWVAVGVLALTNGSTRLYRLKVRGGREGAGSSDSPADSGRDAYWGQRLLKFIFVFTMIAMLALILLWKNGMTILLLLLEAVFRAGPASFEGCAIVEIIGIIVLFFLIISGKNWARKALGAYMAVSAGLYSLAASMGLSLLLLIAVILGAFAVLLLRPRGAIARYVLREQGAQGGKRDV